jgi:uncharacterized damage-inducible protein DinB
MIRNDLRRVFRRDLESLREQIDYYEDEAALWQLPEGIRNSTGTLCLHLCGNLQHFIGAKLGGSDFIRDRDAEFSLRGVGKADLSAQIADCAAVVDRALAGLDDDHLSGEYPMGFASGPLRIHTFLLHLSTHLAYHLGQIDTHRRIVCDNAGAVSTVPIDGLFGELQDP